MPAFYMTYQIDQSGKIEDTTKVTVIALANGNHKSLRIGAGEKQKLIQSLRTMTFPKHTYIFKIFAALIFLLIKDERVKTVLIDQEYKGNEATIKNILIQLFRRFDLEEPEVEFGLVGKKCNAHRVAIATLRQEQKPDLIVGAKEVLKLFYEV